MSASFDDLSLAIEQTLPNLSSQLQRAARYVLRNPDDVALRSMRKTAAESGVQPATMVRLAQAFNFQGYNEFRSVFQTRLRQHPEAYATLAKGLQSEFPETEDILTSVGHAGTVNLQATFLANGAEKFDACAETLLAADRIFFLGLRSSFATAHYFHYVHSLFQDNGILLQGVGGIAMDGLRSMTAGDALMLISVAPYSADVLLAADYANELGASVCALTDSLAAPFVRDGAKTLIVQNESPSFFRSMVGETLVAEAILALMVKKAGPVALERLSGTERFFRRLNTYWQKSS